MGDEVTPQNAIERREALLQMCAWQDSLLQSYRSINLTLQSFLLVILIALVALPSNLNFEQSGAFHIVALVIAVTVAGTIFLTNGKIRNIIMARGNDVSYVHKQIVEVESSLAPADRVFTRFKIDQGGHRNLSVEDARNLFLTDHVITQSDIDQLVTGRLGVARKVIDQNLFDGIYIAAALLIFTKVGLLGIALVIWVSPT